jgi:tetratricopeptide (TPR) repeat protein
MFRPPPRRVWVPAVVALLLAAPFLSLGALRARQSAYAKRLPALPDLSHQPSAVVTHLTEADRAARARPTSAEAVGAAGLKYHADMFYEQAQRCYAIAADLSRDWRWTYYDALASAARGDGQRSRADLLTVVARAADFSPAWWQLGDAEFKAGRFDDARQAWQRILTMKEPLRPPAEPAMPVRTINASMAAYAELGLARIALMQADAGDARQMLEHVTGTSPKFGAAFRLLGDAYTTLNRREDAERAIRIADRLPAYDPYVDPTLDVLVRESRSSTFLLQQASTADLDTNAAWREYLVRRAVEFDPSNVDALADLATMLRVLRRYREALDVLERQRQLVPGDQQVLAEIGRNLIGLQSFAEAEPVLRRALEGVDDANTHYLHGVAVDRLGRLGEAMAEYRQALDRNPTHADALNALAVSLARQGKVDEATRMFERLVASDPDNADAHTNLGALLLAQHKTSQAEREFRLALELSPGHARAREGLQKLGR